MSDASRGEGGLAGGGIRWGIEIYKINKTLNQKSTHVFPSIFNNDSLLTRKMLNFSSEHFTQSTNKERKQRIRT